MLQKERILWGMIIRRYDSGYDSRCLHLTKLSGLVGQPMLDMLWCSHRVWNGFGEMCKCLKIKCTQVDHGFLPAAIYQAGGVRGSLLCLGQSHYQPLDYFHVPDIIFRCRFRKAFRSFAGRTCANLPHLFQWLKNSLKTKIESQTTHFQRCVVLSVSGKLFHTNPSKTSVQPV